MFPRPRPSASVVPAATSGTQANWRYCRKCKGLFFAGNGRGVCPAGGQHNVGTANYTLVYDRDPRTDHQANWRYCRKCGGLFFRPNGLGVCPKGGGHDPSTSGNYSVDYVDP